ncbi:hypothetical protein MTR_1g091900 [Medicago truncatula]|uniref:Uncharacterized protein n=1 Tax=Medicago truncatula TaxID=3880 RepID=G7I327_MEDTR|nr:hypothetical protein MTR_1g091900 [Medicago truncatula]
MATIQPSGENLNEIHPSLSDSSKRAPQSIINDTLARQTGGVHSLKRENNKKIKGDFL